ncbi:MAG: carboxypeptidase-like regulatory domain-containing protein [Candidatus Rokubacteria bacterium]|nr:carboxypeptidase-like regulatory domain-containing protein [Candidatus Rokubacteria bacterium]
MTVRLGLPPLPLSCYSSRVMDGERGPTDSEVSAGAVRRLVQALREHLTLSRFHAIVGIIAGFISISVGLYTYLHFSRPGSPVIGEIVVILQDARTGKPATDATVEILTLKDAVVTTLTPGAEGQARGRLKEGTYRLRVIHPRFVADARQVQIVAGQTAEVRLKLVQPAPKTGPIDDAVGAVKRIFK